MENFQDEMNKLRDANEKYHQRNQELFDEAFEIRKECQSLKIKLLEKERDLKTTEDRYLKLLKDNMSTNAGGASRENRPSSSASTQPSEKGRTTMEKGYEDDF